MNNHMRRRLLASVSTLPSRTISLKEGEHVFRQGQKPKELHIVEQGVVRLLRQLQEGSIAVMHVAREGEWIAEASLFSERYHCHAVADGPARLRAFSKNAVLSLLSSDPDACMALAQEMATRLRDLRTIHEMVRVRRAPDRLLTWLQVNSRGVPPTVVVDRAWTRIAEELAMSREALYRALASLRRDGAIKVSHRIVSLQPNNPHAVSDRGSPARPWVTTHPTRR